MSDPDEWVAALQHIVDIYGRVDIAHLNAGIMTKSEGRDEDADVADCLTFEGYLRIRGVNCDGPALGAIALIPHMEASGGDIVITASVAGLVPFPDDPFYGLTKHAMVGFARSPDRPIARSPDRPIARPGTRATQHPRQRALPGCCRHRHHLARVPRDPQRLVARFLLWPTPSCRS